MTTDIDLRPSCPKCGTFYELRQHPTSDAAWQGVWYDHPQVGIDVCGDRFGSALLPSAAQKQAWSDMGSVPV